MSDVRPLENSTNLSPMKISVFGKLVKAKPFEKRLVGYVKNNTLLFVRILSILRIISLSSCKFEIYFSENFTFKLTPFVQ